MKLSPLDLRKQQFRTTFRGYDPDEVRGFVDKLASDWEEVLEEHRRAEARVAEMEHKMQHYERVEMALQEALEAARETAKRAEEGAKHKAKMIVEEAELRAHQITQDAERERYNMRQDLVKLNARQTEISARLRAFLMSEMEVLAQFQGDDPIGFIKLMSANEHRTPALPPASESTTAPLDAPASSSDAPPSGSAPAPSRETPTPAPEAAPSSFKPASSTPAPSAAERAPVRPIAPPVAPAKAPETSAPMASAPVASPDPMPSRPAAVEPPMAPEKPEASPQGSESAEEEPGLPTYRDVLSAANQNDPEATPPPAAFSSRFFQPKEAEASPAASAAPAPPQHEASPETASNQEEKQGWSLRSLVTGKAEKEKSSVVASDDERERIRRILEDLD